MDSLRKAHSNAQAAGLFREQCMIASFISWLSLDIYDDDGSELWMRRANEMSMLAPEYLDSFIHAINMAGMGSIRGDANLIRKWRDIGVERLRGHLTKRSRRWTYLLEMRARQLEKSPIDVDLAVLELTGHHAANGETGDPSDDEIAVAIQVLAAHGQIDRSHQILKRYFSTFRRGRRPLARTLRDAARVVDWHEGSSDRVAATE
jgi:hypothetical protein